MAFPAGCLWHKINYKKRRPPSLQRIFLTFFSLAPAGLNAVKVVLPVGSVHLDSSPAGAFSQMVKKNKGRSPKSKNHKTMNKELMKFWLTCPFCKKKFGIDYSIVMKYIDRLFSSLGEDIKKKAEEKIKEQERK